MGRLHELLRLRTLQAGQGDGEVHGETVVSSGAFTFICWAATFSAPMKQAE